MSEDRTLFNQFGNNIPAGEVIFKEGDIGERMYIIQKGEVRVTKNIDNKEHILAVLGRGDFFGETAIVTRSPRTATIIAISDVELLSFDREGFASMIEKNAKIALNIIDKLCRRLQSANRQIQHLVKKDSKGLVALGLFYNFNSGTKQLKYDKIIEEISLNSEVPLEKVQQFVDELVSRGVLALSGTHLELKDPKSLEQYT